MIEPKFSRARSLWLLLLGLYSGLPLVALGSTLKARLTEEGFSLATIGVFSSITLPYACKFLWAPLFDRYRVPGTLRRKGWLIATGTGCALSLLLLSQSHSILAISTAALCCAFCSASFDIVVDAYRRESLSSNQLGLGTAFFVNGYRVGMLISGAGALGLADHFSWQAVYQMLAACMGSCLLLLQLLPEDEEVEVVRLSLFHSYLHPLADFFKRDGWLFIVLFILLYKVGDALAGELTMPMYLSLGYTKTDIALVVKGYGLAASLVGALLGGAILLRANLWTTLYCFGILQALSTLAFVALPLAGKPSNEILALVIGFENITGGMGTAAFTALLAQLTNRAFSATQYALLSSLIGVPRAILAAPSGLIAEHIGFVWFFWGCTLIAVPGIFLVSTMRKRVELIQ